MKLIFTDYPRYVPYREYENAITRMVERLIRYERIVSIYQIGSVSTPGISDIDILVVFDDGVECSLNPTQNLSKTERNLFLHSLYGISKTHFHEAQKYTFFHNYNFLWGKELPIGKDTFPSKEIKTLKIQTALEYLIKMYISMTVESIYGIVRLRGLLLHTKALLYDLEFMNIRSGNLIDLIQTMIFWRNNWFECKPDRNTLRTWTDKFYNELTEFLRTTLKNTKFYMPEWASSYISKNMKLVQSERFGHKHKGITMPSIFGGLGRKYFNLQHRFNFFQFKIPFNSSNIPSILENQFIFLKNMKNYCINNLICFMPLTSSLNIL